MKSRLLVCLLALFVAVEAATVEAALTARQYGSDISVNADAQADFYKRYPDLEDERDVVAAAARTLDAEEGEVADTAAAAELLAKRTREILQRRSPSEWQQKAMQLFPELKVAGSEFNTLFLRHFAELKQTSPQFLEEPSWPVLLARRCADELKHGAATTTANRPAKKAPVTAAAPAAPGATAELSSEPAGPRVPSKWVAVISFCALLAILVQPARLMLRCRRAFGGSDGPVTVWQKALGPAAWTYLAMALIALVRTFLANADQRPFDRFGITLLVSLVAGIILALPVYGFSFACYWWTRGRTPPAPREIPRPRPEPATAPEHVAGHKA